MKLTFLQLLFKKFKDEKGAVDTTAEDAGEIESFDNIEDAIDEINEDVEEGEEGSEDEEVIDVENSEQVDRLDAQEGEKRDEQKEENEPKTEDEEASDENKEDEEKTSVPEAKGKAIKGRLGDERFELDESMEFMAKVDGKRERVTLRDLVDNYSGKTAWDKKFTELGQEKKKFQNEFQGYKQERDQIVTSLKQARGMIDQALKGGGDPREGINYLLDLMGYDTYNFNIALTDAMYGDISKLSNMSTAEREAYWSKKELEYVKSRNGNLEKTRKAEQDRLAHRQQVDRLRQAHGVSEEAFTQAFNELVKEGNQNPHVQDVINQAKYASVANKAIDLCTPYEEDLTSQELENLETKVADFLSKNPTFPIEELKSYLDEQYKVGGAVKKLKGKASPKVNDVKIPTKKEGIETFDDLFSY